MARPGDKAGVSDALQARIQEHVRRGELAQAEDLCRQALGRDDQDVVAWQLLALCTRARGDLPQAEQHLHRALVLQPGDPRLLNMIGVIQLEQGQAETAETSFQAALDSDPGYAMALGNLGNAQLKRGRGDRAVESLKRAADMMPDNLEMRFNLGNALRATDRPDEARTAYQACLERNPRFTPALANLAALALEAGALADADSANRQHLALEPQSPGALNTKGALDLLFGRVDDAEAAFRAALSGDDRQAAPWTNLATALAAKGQSDEALTALSKALELEPKSLNALVLDAQLRRDRGDWPLALERLEMARRIAPHDLAVLTTLAGLLQQTCRWRDFTEVAHALDALAERPGTLALPTEPPQLHVSRIDDPAESLKVQHLWSQAIETRMAGERQTLDLAHRPGPRERLTIGYLSQDFRDHPVGHLVRGLFAAHDRTKLRVHGYSYGPDDDSRWRRDIAEGCDRFVDVRGLTHSEAARQIHNDSVDILVDLTGHTKNNRLEICALRPAPIQASWLGFPGGTGADFIDYLLVDPVVAPSEHAPCFSEALVTLPNAYQINDRQQPIAEATVRRTDFGLSETGFVFVCFNQSYKIEPVMFECWMRILGQVPNSQLWLLEKTDGLAAANLRAAAEANGMDPERLVFAGRLPKDQHLARLQLADLGLDTRLYNGHTTTSDALWAGVPVIGHLGRHFASRVTASLLGAVGMPELVVQDLESYESLAVRLAQDRDALRAIRERLWHNRTSAPLFDTETFARHLEQAYERMWQTLLAGEAPSAFNVSP